MEMRTNPAEIHQTMYYRKIGQKQKGACSIQVLVYLRAKTGTSSAIHMQKHDGCCIVWGTCKTEGSAVNTNRMNLYRCHQPDMRTHKHWAYGVHCNTIGFLPTESEIYYRSASHDSLGNAGIGALNTGNKFA